MQHAGNHQQPYWNCKHAIPYSGNPCLWATKFKPVKGWKAKKEKRDWSNKGAPPRVIITYRIEKCPLFERG